MAGDPDLLDDQDDIRDRYQANIAKPAQPASTLRGVSPAESPIAAPTGSIDKMDSGAGALPMQLGTSMRAVNQPDKPTPLQTRTAQDDAQQQNLSKGSGIAQIKNPYARNALRGVNAIGSVLLGRGNMASIPGTAEHHNLLDTQNRANLTADAKADEDQQKTASEVGLQGAQTEALQHPQVGKTPEEQTYASLIAQGMKPEDALAKMKQIGQDVKPDTDPVLGPKVDQLNTALSSRYQVLHPNSQLPPQYTLPPGAAKSDFDRIDKLMEQEEKAIGTKAQQDTANQMRRELAQAAAQNRDFEHNRQTTNDQDKKNAAHEKELAPVQGALDYAETYLPSKHTGPGDEALMEKFFELAKPSSGFRMSQPQIEMLTKARSWMEGTKALAYHALTGTWFSDDQRADIVNTMKALGDAKIKGTQQAGAQQQGQFQPPSDAPPAPKDDGHKLKANGQVIAVSKGGQWVAP